VATVNGMSFDFSNLNLDLNEAQSPAFEAAADPDALVAKFELAKEFLSLGDRVAAKALAQEVHAQATGLLKTRAELFLAELD
jgi:pilus assembly protein FimV